ncbi:unnamed protein product [Vitrella brassicaformis CCMP3155]|uniref:Kinesin motor domain-containing protein n=1 Tax=Vitrella brassicaformis (strain CCMP3155) TaxID=1169540 RepID=A0A0G4FKZ7_VITBC|nr:unnamed protein product [Vitrella brassicaformis CCMP3155]|eukprot:CEM14056.1 unnamed protein product [Vitrella brassicaformis CCMP3155]
MRHRKPFDAAGDAGSGRGAGARIRQPAGHEGGRDSLHAAVRRFESQITAKEEQQRQLTEEKAAVEELLERAKEAVGDLRQARDEVKEQVRTKAADTRTALGGRRDRQATARGEKDGKTGRLDALREEGNRLVMENLALDKQRRATQEGARAIEDELRRCAKDKQQHGTQKDTLRQQMHAGKVGLAEIEQQHLRELQHTDALMRKIQTLLEQSPYYQQHQAGPRPRVVCRLVRSGEAAKGEKEDDHGEKGEAPDTSTRPVKIDLPTSEQEKASNDDTKTAPTTKPAAPDPFAVRLTFPLDVADTITKDAKPVPAHPPPAPAIDLKAIAAMPGAASASGMSLLASMFGPAPSCAPQPAKPQAEEEKGKDAKGTYEALLGFHRLLVSNRLGRPNHILMVDWSDPKSVDGTAPSQQADTSYELKQLLGDIAGVVEDVIAKGQNLCLLNIGTDTSGARDTFWGQPTTPGLLHTLAHTLAALRTSTDNTVTNIQAAWRSTPSHPDPHADSTATAEGGPEQEDDSAEPNEEPPTDEREGAEDDSTAGSLLMSLIQSRLGAEGPMAATSGMKEQPEEAMGEEGAGGASRDSGGCRGGGGTLAFSSGDGLVEEIAGGMRLAGEPQSVAVSLQAHVKLNPHLQDFTDPNSCREPRYGPVSARSTTVEIAAVDFNLPQDPKDSQDVVAALVDFLSRFGKPVGGSGGPSAMPFVAAPVAQPPAPSVSLSGGPKLMVDFLTSFVQMPSPNQPLPPTGKKGGKGVAKGSRPPLLVLIVHGAMPSVTVPEGRLIRAASGAGGGSLLELAAQAKAAN